MALHKRAAVALGGGVGGLFGERRGDGGLIAVEYFDTRTYSTGSVFRMGGFV